MGRAMLLLGIVGLFLLTVTSLTPAATSGFFGIQVYEASDADEAFFVQVHRCPYPLLQCSNHPETHTEQVIHGRLMYL